MTLPPSLQTRIRFSTATEVGAVRLRPDSILQEERGFIGGFRPVKQVFWDEVRAVYVWTTPNWSTVIGGGAVAVIPLLIGLFQLATPLWAAVWIIGALAMLGWSLAWGLRLQPNRWIKIESTQGPLLFHSRREDVLQGILSMLSLDPAHPPATPPPAPGDTPVVGAPLPADDR